MKKSKINRQDHDEQPYVEVWHAEGSFIDLKNILLICGHLLIIAGLIITLINLPLIMEKGDDDRS